MREKVDDPTKWIEFKSILPIVFAVVWPLVGWWIYIVSGFDRLPAPARLAWVFIVWGFLEAARHLWAQRTGFDLVVRFNPMNTWNVVGWQGERQSGDADDTEGPIYHYPTILRSFGYALYAGPFVMACQRKVKVRQGYGTIYKTVEERQAAHDREAVEKKGSKIKLKA